MSDSSSDDEGPSFVPKRQKKTSKDRTLNGEDEEGVDEEVKTFAELGVCEVFCAAGL